METSTPINSDNKFKYPESDVKTKSYEIRSTKRKRLFNSFVEESSDEETAAPAEKKVAIAKEPIFYTESILKTYSAKEYEKCLSLIDEAMSLPIYHPQYMAVKCTQYKIIQAACWTMTGLKVPETFAILKEVIEAEPQNSFALYGYGLAQYRNGDFNSCIESFAKAIHFNPSGAMKRAMEYKAKARTLLDMANDAHVQFELNNCSRAIEVLNAAILIDPENEKATKNILSIRDFFMKDLISRLEAEIESDIPDKYSEAEKMIRANKHAEAEKLVKEICNEEPMTAQACYIKGLSVLYMSGGLKESLSHFKEALALKPSLKNALEMEAKTKKLLNLVEKASQEMAAANYPEAIETLTEALKVDNDNNIINQASYFQRALAYFNQGSFKNAFEDYKKFEILKKIVGNVMNDIETKDTEEEEKEPEPVTYWTPESPKMETKKDLKEETVWKHLL